MAWVSCTTGKPVGVGTELQSQLFVVDAEIPVPAAGHGFRHQILHFLRDDADIGLAAAEIAEAVVTETVREMAEQFNVMLQFDVGASSTAAAAEAASTSASEATTATAAASEAAAPSTGKCHTAAARAHARHACAAAGGLLRQPYPTRPRAAATASAISARGALARLAAFGTITAAGLARSPHLWHDPPCSADCRHDPRHDRHRGPPDRRCDRLHGRQRPVGPVRTKHLLPVTAAKIHPVRDAGLRLLLPKRC